MEVDVTAPAGFEGIVQILIEGLVAGSVDIPAGGSGASADRGDGLSRLGAAVSGARSNENVVVRTYTQAVDAQFDPLFEDGERSTEAVLSGRPTRQQLARAQAAQNPTLNNQDRFVYTVSSARSFQDPFSGPLWRGGSVQLDGRFPDYAGSGSALGGFGSALIQILDGGAVTVDSNVADRSVTLVLNPVLFPIEGPVQLNQITLQVPGGDPVIVPIVNHEVEDANDDDLEGFFDFTSRIINLDNRSPFSAVQFQSLEPGEKWVNRSFDPALFASSIGFVWTGGPPLQTVNDEGSGENGPIDCGFFIFKDPSAVFPFTTAADFDEGPEDWTFEVACVDPIDNELRLQLENPFGNLLPLRFDFTNPDVERATGAGHYDDREITLDLTQDFFWNATDDLSGAAANNWKWALEVDRPGLTPAERCVVGEPDEATGECNPSEIDASLFEIDTSLEVISGTFVTNGLLGVGYNRATVVAPDEAGNESAPSTTTILHNPGSPTVTVPPTHGGSLPGGGSASIDAAARDFVDIVRARYDQVYFGERPYTSTPGFEGNQPFFGGWSLGWNNEFTLTETIDPVITSVEPVLNFFNPAPSGTPALLNELALFVANVGGNVARSAVDVRNDWTGPVTGFANQGVTYFQIESLNSNGICNAPGGVGCVNPTELIITAEIRTQGIGSLSSIETNLIWPYVTSRNANPPGDIPGDAWFSLRDRVTEATRTSVDMGTYTQHTYVVTVPAAGLPSDSYELIMLGVNSDGNALRTVTNFFGVQGF